MYILSQYVHVFSHTMLKNRKTACSYANMSNEGMQKPFSHNLHTSSAMQGHWYMNGMNAVSSVLMYNMLRSVQ